jgi:hypothetical protein
MTFTQEEIQTILNIIEYHHMFAVAWNLGPDTLTDDDRRLLSSFGVDLDALRRDLPQFDKIYHWGRLTAILKDSQSEQVGFGDFVKYILKGWYAPLTRREQFELELAKKKSYVHLKGLSDKVKKEISSTMISKEKYEDTIKQEIVSGVEKRKASSEIVSEIGHKLGTWKNDYQRIVQTEMQDLYNLSRAEVFREKEGDDVRVYKQVYEKACRHCIRLYLKNGIGSEPIVKPLSEVKANGNNYGLKVADWKFVLGPTHPYCRCDLRYVPKNYVFNSGTGGFELPKHFQRQVERRSKIKIQVGDKSFDV